MIRKWWDAFVHWWNWGNEYAEYCKICNPKWDGFRPKENQMTDKTELPELKSCPFCGCETIHLGHPRRGRHYAECQQCFANVCDYNTQEEAVKAWNTRSEPQADEVERLRVELDRYEAMFSKVGLVGIGIVDFVKIDGRWHVGDQSFENILDARDAWEALLEKDKL